MLDLGCGVGAQTLCLAELTAGTLVAIDQHAPSIEHLKATLAAQGLTQRVRALVGDMAELDPTLGPFDLELHRRYSDYYAYEFFIARRR